MRDVEKEPFSVVPHDPGDKYLTVVGPATDGYYTQVVAHVDFDDVDHEAIKPQVERMVKILNANWGKPDA